MNLSASRGQRLAGEPLESRYCLTSIGFAFHDIDSATANDLMTADLDGDGDLDVLAAMAGEVEIAWYENIDGKGGFGDRRAISAAEDSLLIPSVIAEDFDGDGDLDVASASFWLNTIAWYENTDGQGSFGRQQVITTDAFWATSIFPSDVDGDGDADILSSSMRDNKLAWYENTDGKGTFGEQRVITQTAHGPTSVYAGDLDSDGDVDVLSAETGDEIVWYENTSGTGLFGSKRVISSNAHGFGEVFAEDLDGDGDLDVLATAAYDEKVAWYENTDGRGNFGDERVITAINLFADSLFAADFDADGDVDVLAVSGDDRIEWHENTDGTGNFAEHVVSVRRAIAVYAGDIDRDGDLDVLSGALSTIAWFDNRPIGDSNNDGIFDSSDLVTVFQVGKYEDGIPDNTTFDEGDWNQDGEFDSSDLVLAFQAQHYVAAAVPIASELAAAVDRLFAFNDNAKKGRAFVA